jgi:hypothetical protein
VGSEPGYHAALDLDKTTSGEMNTKKTDNPEQLLFF